MIEIRFRISLFCFFCLVSYSTSSFQQQVDEQFINELILAMEGGSSSSMADIKYQLKEIDSLSKTISYGPGRIFANLTLSGYFGNSNLDDYTNYISVLDSIFESDSDQFSDTTLVRYYLEKGQYFGANINYIEELNYYLKADTFVKNNSNEYLSSEVSYHISIYYNKKKDFKNAIKYNRELLSYYKDLEGVENKMRYLLLTRNNGAYHFGLENYDSTIFYVNKAIDDGLGDYLHLGYAYEWLIKAYIATDELENAEKFLTLADIEFGDEIDYTLTGVNHNLLKGEFYRNKKNYPQAIKYIKTALSFADSIDFKHGQLKANYDLLETELLIANRTDLVANLILFKQFKEDTYAETSLQHEKQLLVQYETGKKEAEIERLKFLDQVNQTTKLGIILSSIIIILIIILLLYKNNMKRKLLTQKLIAIKLEKEVANNNLIEAIRHVEEKAKVINGLKSELEHSLEGSENINELVSILDKNYVDENHWTKVLYYYDRLNDNFTKKVNEQFKNLTQNDIHLLVLIQLNYSNKKIAVIKNVSDSAIKKAKQRLLKKMELNQFSDLSLIRY